MLQVQFLSLVVEWPQHDARVLAGDVVDGLP
jgi:hypothetical protein